MIWIYWAATIFGCAFLVPMVLGGLDSDVDGFGGDADLGGGLDVDTDVGGGLELDSGLDMDMDIDMDVDVDSGNLGHIGSTVSAGSDLSGPDVGMAGGADLGQADVGEATGGGLGDAFSAVLYSLISFRTLVFFAAFFGTSGLVFTLANYSPAVTVASAAMIGGIAAVANSLLFGLIKNSQPNSQISDRTLEGRPATVVLPMEADRRGRIRVNLSGQPQYIVAKPMEGLEQRFDVGASVVVVKIENGTAHVASLAELE